MKDISTDEPSVRWGNWLQARLAERGWSQADLVRESGGLIRRDRASKWSRGMERPSHRSAIVVANVLDLDHADVLEIAGYEVAGQYAEGASGSPDAVPPSLEDYSEIQLLDELRRRAFSRAGDREKPVNWGNLAYVGGIDDAEVASPKSVEAAMRRPIAAKRGRRKGDEEPGAE